ncbi:MAG: aldehyde dehydrogenase family protein [Planctomycetota bacterium]|nr:aldehyde dehydrogenase family protein [Planctomycetota bacterium]
MTYDLVPHIPALRFGRPYESLDVGEVKDCRSGRTLARLSLANGGLVRRDLLFKQDAAFEALQRLPVAALLEACAKAGELFMRAELPLGAGHVQSPERYVETLSATSGLPHNMCRANMEKIHHVLTKMPTILKGLTRGMDLSVLDRGVGEQSGVPVCYVPMGKSLGVVLPSNSPGVNSLWLPAVALKIPVVLKPGREEPWTPWRLVQALVAAGLPAEAFGFFPCDHDGADAILRFCGRGMVFGDEKTVAKYAANPGIQPHGPGYSKILIGLDEIENWRAHLDVLVQSILANGGRSCVNASAVLVPKHGRAIAEALAERLGPVAPRPPADPEARLSAFANPAFAEYIDGAIEDGLRVKGAEDLAARFRGGPRKALFEGSTYLRPTVVWCDSFEHPLANREFLFPYASVLEVPQEQAVRALGPSLVVSAITRDEGFMRELLLASHIDRLNLGPVPTVSVSWDQPHEGNLFEFLYHRRAIQRVGA